MSAAALSHGHDHVREPRANMVSTRDMLTFICRVTRRRRLHHLAHGKCRMSRRMPECVQAGLPRREPARARAREIALAMGCDASRQALARVRREGGPGENVGVPAQDGAHGTWRSIGRAQGLDRPETCRDLERQRDSTRPGRSTSASPTTRSRRSCRHRSCREPSCAGSASTRSTSRPRRTSTW